MPNTVTCLPCCVYGVYYGGILALARLHLDLDNLPGLQNLSGYFRLKQTNETFHEHS